MDLNVDFQNEVKLAFGVGAAKCVLGIERDEAKGYGWHRARRRRLTNDLSEDGNGCGVHLEEGFCNFVRDALRDV